MNVSDFDLTKTRPWNWLLELVRYLMIICSVASTGCILIACILRYIFKANLYGSDEVILLFAFWLYFMGAVHGSYEDSHIKADLLNVYIKNIRIKDFIGLIAQVIMIVVNLVFLVWSWDYFLWGLRKMPLSTGLKIPLVIPQSAIFFGLLLMEFYHLVHFVRNIKLYRTMGHYSVPQEGDYMTAETKARFPQANVPLKSEVDRAKREGGEG